ncbi:MAG: site-specific DNA-methyltransferase [Dehalococcoidia bacterium]|jgi:site-specific DNA-methyltransferase (cytosine-N4-specific)
MYLGTAEEILTSPIGDAYKSKVQLILTSPPFPLNRKKAYGNLTGQAYIDWLSSTAQIFKDLLTPDGSLVIELGNAWEKGKPTMSTLPLRALLSFLDRGDFYLCEQFIYYNQARLPTPAQWVNIERVRVKDAYTHLWWMSPSSRPKADNRKILKKYSAAMLNLLEKQEYNAGKRPSEHHVGMQSFLHDNNGSIPSNVLIFANTSATDPYQRYCRNKSLKPHPARMAYGVAEFFIKFLTEPGDIVLDPFAGSNTTGAAADKLGRHWISCEPLVDYIEGSKGRFSNNILKVQRNVR